MSARANTTKVEPDHPERVTADEIAHLLLTWFGVVTTGEEWDVKQDGSLTSDPGEGLPVPTERSQLNINCSSDLLARVKARARLEGITVTELVTRLLEEELQGDGGEASLADRLAQIEERLRVVEQRIA
jgi:hypothetical protein